MHTASFTRLPNGLRVVTVQRPHLHQVVIAASIHAGSRHETRGTNGLTHFLEHMLFRGTKHLPTAAAFNHRIESLGGTLTAATHGDFTLFQLTVPPDALAEGCAELGEVFMSPVFSDCQVEKSIVREEILENLDEDGRDVNADNVLRAAVFGQHPLGFPITGSVTNVERFTERHLRAHMAEHYVAKNMSVTVVGPVGHRAMIRAATRAFGALPPGAARASSPFRRQQSRARIRTVHCSSAQTTVRIAFPTPGQRAASARALELLLRVLDDGMSTRLHRRICDEKGLAYEVNAGLELFDDTGIFDVAASVAHASLPDLVGEVLGILADLAVAGPTRAEVEKAHRRYAFELDAMEDDAHALADFYGPPELFSMRQSPAERRREVLGVTAQDVRRAARSILDPSRANIVLVGDADADTRAEMSAALRRFRAKLQGGLKARTPTPVSALKRVASRPRRAGVLDLSRTSP
jgi:predicted Zn-dependent peptidase